MSKRPRSPKNNVPYTLGRTAFARISAIEGIRLTASMDADFREFDKKRLSPQKRRAILVQKYAKVGR